jgi:site-specific DNA-methyltransferase (adenine-specific)
MIEPYYQEDGITLYCGDCREILPELERVDLVLTDPPYGHGKKWSGGTWASNPIYDAAFEWDARPVDNELLLRAVQFGDVAIVWGGNYFSLPPSRCWLEWEKSSKMDTLADFELAWTNLDKPSKKWKEDRNPDGKRSHPTQKPLSLMEWCINFSGEGLTILDPFAGSGTTLIAAKRLQRKAIGIEISEKYCQIAVNRLRQMELFTKGEK